MISIKSDIEENSVILNPELSVGPKLMFWDEASFGRITSPARAWAPQGIRPVVKCQQVREYVNLYGAVCPETGESFFSILPFCNTECVNAFLKELSERFPDDYIILIGDNASWHKSEQMKLPENIELLFIPPRTPEMNPIEQVWEAIREDGFKNRFFQTLDEVENKIFEVVGQLTKEIISRLTFRSWLPASF